MESYVGFASLYDRLTFDVDYNEAAGRISEILDSEPKRPELVLDLACGTGTLTKLLSEHGYDMIGADSSEAMLNIAREKCPDALLLLQDMREFELYGTIDAAVCMLDSINYLTEDGDLDKVFHLLNNYLIPEGILIFDINTEYKFKNVLKDETFTFETDDIFYVWENDYSEEEGLCDFYLTFFEQGADGRYARVDEVHTERVYSQKEIEDALKRNGFRIEKCCDGYTDVEATSMSERICYVCRNVCPIQKG